MNDMKPGIYRGGSPGCFGLWRLTHDGRWLFSMPVDGQRWRAATLDGGEVEKLVLIAPDTESGPAQSITADLVRRVADALILRFHEYIDEDAPTDAIDQIAHVALVEGKAAITR